MEYPEVMVTAYSILSWN